MDGFESCAEVLDCGSREIEVLFTAPFCDECSSSDKTVLLERSQIIKRVVGLIDGASTSIRVAQFTFSRKEIEQALLRAQSRGVGIRVAMDTGQDNPNSLATRLQTAGVDVRFVPGRDVNGRLGLLHTKFMMVDDRVLLTGSNNWSSTGTSINNENTMVLRGRADDEIIKGFACNFESIWNADLNAAASCSGENVFFTPGSAARRMIQDSIGSATSSIDVLMHHFTLRDLAKELAKAQERGVSVRIIVNEADRTEVQNSSFQRLLDAGGEIHFKRVNEDAYQFMHNKLAIFDGKVLVNGSGNWSGAAFFDNYENFVRYYEPQVVRDFEDMYERLWAWSVSAEGLEANRTAAQEQALEYQAYFGNLHAHFRAVDGDRLLDDGKALRLGAGGVEVPVDVGTTVFDAAAGAFSYAQEVGGLDFMALSPHTSNDSLTDNLDMPNMSQEGYGAVLDAVAKTNEKAAGEFVALASMEWSTNSRGNHVGIFGTDTIAKVERGEFSELYDGFLRERLDSGERPLVMFNHPKTFRLSEDSTAGSWDQIFGINLLEIAKNSERNRKFNDYGLDDYSPLRELLPLWIAGSALPDEAIVAETLANLRDASAPYARLMEVTLGRGNEFGSERERNPSLTDDGHRTKVHDNFDYYLSHGFRIAPVANHDNHYANWGAGHTTRTGVIARSLSKKSLLDALDRRAVFASEDPNLSLRFYVDDRVPMGAETTTTASSVHLSALITDPDYNGPYEVRVFKGALGEAVTETHATTMTSDGWLELDVPVASGATHVLYLEVYELDVDRTAWTAPIWVEAL